MRSLHNQLLILLARPLRLKHLWLWTQVLHGRERVPSLHSSFTVQLTERRLRVMQQYCARIKHVIFASKVLYFRLSLGGPPQTLLDLKRNAFKLKR